MLKSSAIFPDDSTTASTSSSALTLSRLDVRGADRSTAKSNSGALVRFRTFLRNTVYEVMKDRGWKEVESESEWDIIWADVHWVHENFDNVYLQEHQRINHYRNHYELTRKDLLVKNVKRMIRYMDKEYGRSEASKFEFICPSFVLPQEHALFQEEFRKNPSGLWIMKPVGRAQGKGIFLVNKLSQINQWRKDPKSMVKNLPERKPRNTDGTQEQVEDDKPEAYIVQKYIENPYLIGGKKFDIRIYVLVTSFSPLVVYIHRNGFCRFSNYQFSIAAKDISNMFIHATNVAIQKTSPQYSADKGCKWLLRNLKMYLMSRHSAEAVDSLFTEMEALIVRSLMCVQRVMIQDKHCFELYGYDVLIDDNLKPWLLECNASPSLSAETQWDYDLKHNMLNDVFDIIDVDKKNKGPKSKTGGFDLVYNDGPVKHEKSSRYVSFLGCHHPIPKSPRVKKFRHGKLAPQDPAVSIPTPTPIIK